MNDHLLKVAKIDATMSMTGTRTKVHVQECVIGCPAITREGHDLLLPVRLKGIVASILEAFLEVSLFRVEIQKISLMHSSSLIVS